MHRAFLFLFFFPLSLLGAADRYALVFGNSAYAYIEKLATPANDAADVAAALEKLGYAVDLRIDADILTMEEALDALYGRLAGDKENEGFVWYAGHGVQVEGENYLLPVDVRADRVSQVRRSSCSLNDLLKGLEVAGNMVNVVVLDACRNNPLPTETRGLNRGLATAPVIQDTFVMFSTSAGSTAADGAPGSRNSPFTEAFLKYIDKPESLDSVAKDVARETMAITRVNQRPYISDNILFVKDYSLNPQGVQRYASYGMTKQVIDLGYGRSVNAGGALDIMTITAGTVEIAGEGVNEKTDLPEWGSLAVTSVDPGSYTVTITYIDGKSETRRIVIEGTGAFEIDFSYRPAAGEPAVIVRPGPAKPDQAKPEPASGRYALDGQRSWSVGVSYSGDFMNITFPGAELRYTFFEQYRDYGTLFFLPNAFFAGFIFSGNNIETVLSRKGFYSYGAELGALYKIRLGSQQRFIANAGLSADMLFGSYRYQFYESGRYQITEPFVEGFAGFHGGIAFRFAPAFSLNLDIAYFLDILGPKPLRGGGSYNFDSLRGNLGISWRRPY
jgi:hypothetical protein